MDDSGPGTPWASKNMTLSACKTYVYRCRKNCFHNCDGGAECEGIKFTLAGVTPTATPDQTPSATPQPPASISLSRKNIIVCTIFLTLC